MTVDPVGPGASLTPDDLPGELRRRDRRQRAADAALRAEGDGGAHRRAAADVLQVLGCQCTGRSWRHLHGPDQHVACTARLPGTPSLWSLSTDSAGHATRATKAIPGLGPAHDSTCSRAFYSKGIWGGTEARVTVHRL